MIVYMEYPDPSALIFDGENFSVSKGNTVSLAFQNKRLPELKVLTGFNARKTLLENGSIQYSFSLGKTLNHGKDAYIGFESLTKVDDSLEDSINQLKAEVVLEKYKESHPDLDFDDEDFDFINKCCRFTLSEEKFINANPSGLIVEEFIEERNFNESN